MCVCVWCVYVCVIRGWRDLLDIWAVLRNTKIKENQNNNKEEIRERGKERHQKKIKKMRGKRKKIR